MVGLAFTLHFTFDSNLWSHGKICYNWFRWSPCEDLVNGNCILLGKLPRTWGEINYLDKNTRHILEGECANMLFYFVLQKGDITDLAVSSNNAVVASASNDFVIRVVSSLCWQVHFCLLLYCGKIKTLLAFLCGILQWRLPDGLPISVLRGHTGAVTAIAFSPRAAYQLLS